MDTVLYYLSCGCCDSGYEHIAYNRGGNDKDTEWVISMFDSSSGEEEEEDSENDQVGIHPYIEDEDSLDDTQYYRQYTPNVHLIGDSDTFKQIRHKTSLEQTLRHANDARTAMALYYNQMTRQVYSEILICYVLALEYCPPHCKRSLIREYEHFKQIYASLVQDDTADRYALAYWKEAHSPLNNLSRRITYYRLAIMCVDDANFKRQWKIEYNKFFKAHQHTDTL